MVKAITAHILGPYSELEMGTVEKTHLSVSFPFLNKVCVKSLVVSAEVKKAPHSTIDPLGQGQPKSAGHLNIHPTPPH